MSEKPGQLDDDVKHALDQLKIKMWTRIAWGTLIVFVFIGALLGKPQAPYVALVASLLWVLLRIFNEAIEAHATLQIVKKAEEALAKTNADPK